MELTNNQIWILVRSLEDKIEKWKRDCNDYADGESWGALATTQKDIYEAKQLIKMFGEMQK